mgnify:FL=1
MEFGVIATGHGPVLTYNIPELMNKYETWSKQALEKQLATVAVLYISDYGYSDRLSQVRIYTNLFVENIFNLYIVLMFLLYVGICKRIDKNKHPS